MNIRELLDKRAGLIAQARGILDNAEAEKRGLTTEEQTRWDALMDEANDIQATVARMERQLAIEASLADSAQAVREAAQDGRPDGYRFISRSLSALNEMGTGKLGRLAGLLGADYRSAFISWLADGGRISAREARALQADIDTGGGYLYAPLQLVDRLIKAVDDAVYIRQWATVIPVTDAESLGAPSLDSDPADADWTTELSTGSEDTSMAFGRRALTPKPLAKRIKISRKLLRKAPNAEDLVVQRLAYKFAATWEKAALTGSGAGQPLGVFTASGQGISTSRDVSEDNTTTAITMDGLINAKYALKQPYWARARWLFHRDVAKTIAKLKDSNGQYIWRESTRAGEPDRLLGIPVFLSEYAPSTMTAGQYVGILGDFSNYWVADSLAMEFQRLEELYAETNQVGIIGRMESDGMPVLAEAFVRVKLASS